MVRAIQAPHSAPVASPPSPLQTLSFFVPGGGVWCHRFGREKTRAESARAQGTGGAGVAAPPLEGGKVRRKRGAGSRSGNRGSRALETPRGAGNGGVPGATGGGCMVPPVRAGKVLIIHSDPEGEEAILPQGESR